MGEQSRPKVIIGPSKKDSPVIKFTLEKLSFDLCQLKFDCCLSRRRQAKIFSDFPQIVAKARAKNVDFICLDNAVAHCSVHPTGTGLLRH